MKTEFEIRRAIRAMRNDPNMTAPPAMVEVNEVLALIQCKLEGQMEALRWVLDENPRSIVRVKSPERK